MRRRYAARRQAMAIHSHRREIPMNKDHRDALRAAALIHEQLTNRNLPASAVHLPRYSWAAIERLQRQVSGASGRGWHLAARRLREQMADAIRRCHMELETALRTVESHIAPRLLSTSSEIYRDILALYAEFDEVEIDFGSHEIRVTTDAIVFSEIDLGRFDICFDWQRLGESQPYRVVARDSNPASQNQGVTHPHVQDEALCEGDGRAAIQTALAQGRLYDFILMVSQVLHTYARGSAYVEMDNWNGITCSDCGTTMSSDDSYSCQRCGCELCDECRQSCAACEESYCSACLSCCPECELDFCRGCMEVCPACRRNICSHCMEDGLCPSCRAEQSQDEEEDNDDDKSDNCTEGQPAERAGIDSLSQEARQAEGLAGTGQEKPDATIEPDRLGEALVPA
jgi:hypothetical protein